MYENVTRRSALGVLGVGVLALTGGASRRSRCAVVTGRTGATCGDALSLSGPESVARSDPNPEFVARNEAATSVRVETGDWALYRQDGSNWTAVGSGPGGGSRALEPGEETSWVLLLDGGDDGSESSGGVGALSTQTRYVGPVDATPGEYAFVARGHRDDTPFEAVSRFAVAE